MTPDRRHRHTTVKNRSSLSLTILLLSLSFLSLTCTTAPEDKRLQITSTDASCTEAWIQVTGEAGKQIVLTRDSKEVRRFILTSSPMEIMDDTLAAKTTYAYAAIRADNGERSNSVDITTLDTTSHNFTWQTFTFGDPKAGSSTLNDIAIISENDIWAVGEIYITDTSANGFTTYNAVHWNGSQWEQLTVPYYYQGQSYFHPMISVAAFGSNDIWFCGNGIVHMVGSQFSPIPIPSTAWGQDQINRMWGTSGSDFYVVGNSGSIAHSYNGQWSKLESGTDLPFQDIWGSNGEILAIASDEFGFGGQYLVSISGNTVKQIPTNITTASAFSSLWFQSNRKYFLAGNGIYTSTNPSSGKWQTAVDANIQPIYSFGIRGNGLNDIVAVGDRAKVVHYNGMNWKFLEELQGYSDRLWSVAIKSNLVVIVGNRSVSGIENYGLIHMGRRT